MKVDEMIQKAVDHAARAEDYLDKVDMGLGNTQSIERAAAEARLAAAIAQIAAVASKRGWA